MTGRTHDLSAFTALLLVIISVPNLPVMTLPTAVIAFGANFIGGLFPDIDQPTSDFWDNFRLGPFVAKIVCPALGGHRHVSHSLIGMVLIGLGSDIFFEVISRYFPFDTTLVWYSFMIGVVSHVIMDLPTKAGVPLLWPLGLTFGIPPVKALRIQSGKFVENILIFPGLLIFDFYLLYTHQEFFLELLHQYIR